jgi:hypothetical protein
MENVSVVKAMDGMLIIGQFDGMKCKNPFAIMPVTQGKTRGVSLVPYILFSEDDSVTFEANSLIYRTTPDSKTHNAYVDAIKDFKAAKSGIEVVSSIPAQANIVGA